MLFEFKPLINCWNVVPADRAAVIVDGAAYFRALHQALRSARRSIMIIGWDLHSELQLIRGGDNGGYPDRLGDLLDALAQERKDLDWRSGHRGDYHTGSIRPLRQYPALPA